MFFYIPCPWGQGEKELPDLEKKGLTFLFLSILVHFVMAFVISFLPQGNSLTSQGKGICYVRLLGGRGVGAPLASKEIPKGPKVHSRAKRRAVLRERGNERVKAVKVASRPRVSRLSFNKSASSSPSMGSKASNGEGDRVSMNSVASKGNGRRVDDEGQWGVIPPMPTFREKPPYPLLARKRGYEGRLVLRLLVSAQGNVDRVVVLKSTGYAILDKAAVKTARRWRFSPAIEGGRPVKYWVEVPVVFSLREKG